MPERKILSRIQKTDRNPLVTIYITNYNYASYIKQAIDSALNQTFDNYEVIIIDDGSSDNSYEIINNYKDHQKVRVIFQNNKGLNATNNIAIKASRGKYIMRLDADDYLDENALLVLTDAITKNTKLAMVFPDYYYVDKEGRVMGQEKRHNFDKQDTLLDTPAHGACTLLRKDVLLEVGAYSPQFTCQDGYDLWLKIIERYEVKNVSLPLFYYRRHGKNITEDSKRILQTRAQIMDAHVKRTKKNILKTVAVLPIRGPELDNTCLSMDKIGGKSLLCWTLEAALNSENVNKVIVSTPDSNILNHLNKEYKGRVLSHHRDSSKVMENVSFEGVIEDVVETQFANEEIDAILCLTVNAPFRSSLYIDKAINSMRILNLDIVLGVVPDEGHFFQHDGTGLHPIGINPLVNDLRFERDYIYRQVGGLMLMKFSHFFSGRNLFDGKVGHVILDKMASLSMHSSVDLKIADIYLKNEMNN